MIYKKQYTEEEIADLKKWFEEHKDKLPSTLQLDTATFIPNVEQAVRQLMDIADIHRHNPTFSGQIYLLYRIKEKIEEGL